MCSCSPCLTLEKNKFISGDVMPTKICQDEKQPLKGFSDIQIPAWFTSLCIREQKGCICTGRTSKGQASVPWSIVIKNPAGSCHCNCELLISRPRKYSTSPRHFTHGVDYLYLQNPIAMLALLYEWICFTTGILEPYFSVPGKPVASRS